MEFDLVTVVATSVIGIGVFFVLKRFFKRRDPFEDRPFHVVQTTAPSAAGKRDASEQSGDRGSSFVAKMKTSKKTMVVFYGSQTGTAEGFACRLAKDARRFGIGAMAVDPEGFSFDELAEMTRSIDKPVVVFSLATYGEGDPTDNAVGLKEWLDNAANGSSLKGLRYAVFGLGNKTYENYNSMGKLADKQLEVMGATRVCELGLGDDDANMEDDFVTWSEKFWLSVCDQLQITAASLAEQLGASGVSSRQYQLVEFEPDRPLDNLFTGEPARLRSYQTQKPPFDAKNPFLAKIIEKKELHKGGERSCLHVEFDISGSRMRYDAGDHVAILPENDENLVQALARRLNIDLNRAFMLENLDPEASRRHPFPCPCTYGTALRHYIDITSPPRTHVLRELAAFAKDNEEQRKHLEAMSSSSNDGRTEYAKYILDSRRDILTLLMDMPSLAPPIDLLLELLPRLQPRYYSIASSPKLHPTSVHIAAVVVEYKTKTGRIALGVATNFLKRKSVGDTIPIFVRRSQFRLPFRPSVPVVMIGPGTGLAPMRGFIQDRFCSKRDGKPIGDTILYFGCRRRDEDYLYEEDLSNWQGDGTLSQLHVAFSRDQGQKVYVQHLVRKHAADFWKLIEQSRAHIYVCGDAKSMAPDVYSTLAEIIADQGKMDRAAALDYMKRLSKQGRYSADVWS